MGLLKPFRGLQFWGQALSQHDHLNRVLADSDFHALFVLGYRKRSWERLFPQNANIHTQLIKRTCGNSSPSSFCPAFPLSTRACFFLLPFLFMLLTLFWDSSVYYCFKKIPYHGTFVLASWKKVCILSL